MAQARSAFETSRALVKDYYDNKVRLVVSFLGHWVPMSVKWDLSVLHTFVSQSGRRSFIHIKDIHTEVYILCTLYTLY